MTDLRKYAEGKPCMIRLPEICNSNPETTVLTHYRMAGNCGMGQKPPDIFGAWGCSSCHDEVDRRTHVMPYDDARSAHLEGVYRTQAQLVRDQILKW